MHYVYVLQNSKGQLYKGYTIDLKLRIIKHNTGAVKSTKNGRPWTLIYYEAFLSKGSAKR